MEKSKIEPFVGTHKALDEVKNKLGSLEKTKRDLESLLEEVSGDILTREKEIQEVEEEQKRLVENKLLSGENLLKAEEGIKIIKEDLEKTKKVRKEIIQFMDEQILARGKMSANKEILENAIKRFKEEIFAIEASTKN